MTIVNNDNRSKSSRVGKNRWARVREAYKSGELDRQHIIFQPEHKRPRRNALADIAAVSTNENATSQKHQFHQLVERVRELQKEIVPDHLLYKIPPTYSSFSPVALSSNASRGSISLYPHRQSISISSGSSNSPVPNQRFALSSRILERAHEIPERFWIDWQQKQMQDQIEELEYIKSHMGFNSTSSLLSNETDENEMDPPIGNRRNSDDDLRRKSFLFLQEAKRLANERRASLARTTTIDESISENIEKPSDVSDNDDHNSFDFDQRSEETADTANLNDLNEGPSKPITSISSVPRSPPVPIPSVPQSSPTPIPSVPRPPLTSISSVLRSPPTPISSVSQSSQTPISSVIRFPPTPIPSVPRSPLTPISSVLRSSQTPISRVPRSPPIPIPSVPQSPPTPNPSRSTISLPFTYINTQEQIRFPNSYRSMYIEPMLEKVVKVNDDAIQTTSPTNSIEDVAQIDTEFNLTLLKREQPKEIRPLLYSKATVSRSIEFRKLQPISSQNTTMSSKKDRTIHISICKRKEIHDSRSSSPTLSFKSALSRFSSIDNGEDLDDDIQSSTVIPPSLSVSSHSRSTSSHIISTVTQCCDHNNNSYPSSHQQSSHKCTCFIQNRSMIDVYNLEQKCNSSSCSSCSIVPSEEENNLSFSRTLFTCRHRQRKQQKKGNASNLSLVSTPSSQNKLTSLHNLLYQAKENDNNNNNNKRTLKIASNTSIISSKSTREWKQNDGGFQRDVLTNDNSEEDDDFITRSSSSSATAAPDFFIRRQRRKQTRLKRKTGSEKRKEKKKKKKKERNKKSPSSTTGAEASLFQSFAVDTPTIDTSASFYPYEQAKCADRSTAKEENCFSIQTSEEHHQQQKQESKSNLTMADGHDYTTPNPTPKKKENVRVFVRRRRRTTKHQKRVFLHSSSSNNSHETIPSSSSSSSTNVQELISLIQQQINNKQKTTRNNKNIIVVNYKPVFVNSRQQKLSQTTKSSPTLLPKPKILPTDDDFSSATHYSRRRSLTTTSSDGSPLRSSTNRLHNQQSISLDVPDIEDPLMFIEMMYQQLFTEDGQLRSGTEPTVLANCVKQIVTHSRRNSISSSITNGSTSSHLKHKNLNTTHQQPKFSSPSYHPLTASKPISLSSSPHLIPNEHYDTFSEEEEEEPQTVVQMNNQLQTIKTNIDISGRNSRRSGVDNPDTNPQIHAFLNSCQQKRTSINRTTTVNNGFHFSIDDTDNEDLDTFSDLNSTRFNNKTIRTSPSIEEDLTHTDSRLLSSSGYQSLDRSRKSLQQSQQQQQKPILSKSHSENDLLHKNDTQIKCIHYCPNCIRPPTITVISPPIPTSSSSNIIQRIQQPVRIMLMKYVNFILISKNVLLLPLFIFLLRQRSIYIGN